MIAHMVFLVFLLLIIALAISLPLAAVNMRLGRRLGMLDTGGVPGQVKASPRAVPNTGGVAIFWGIAIPVLAGLGLIWLDDGALIARIAPAALEHIPGIRAQTPLALALLACLAVLHILGLVDDRRPLGPWLKLAIMALPALAIPLFFPETRLLDLLSRLPLGVALSIAITVLWFLVVTNAMNFMDNMDGLSAGVAAIAGLCFLVAALVVGQWFVAAMLAVMIGACLGFLVFNFPRASGARIFMGDGGSLVLGFLLAFLTVRTTYYEGPAGPLGGGWYAVFMPLVVLAVPIYDFASVVSIRLSQGRSPFVGDMQHLSHRLVNLGLSRRAAVLVIYGLTAATGISGIVLGSLQPWQAMLVGIQIIVLLGVIALFEYARARRIRPGSPLNTNGDGQLAAGCPDDEPLASSTAHTRTSEAPRA